MLEILKAILFGIVEGVTEWIPISSTGHLILLQELLPLKVSAEFWEMFQVVIQLGAICAVILLYFKKLNPFSKTKSPEKKRKTWDLWFHIAVAVIPSAIVGFFVDDWFDAHLYNYITVAITLILYGAAFIYVEKKRESEDPRIRTVGAIDYKTALIIGAFQILSLVPGTSRSGATILGAILIGTSRTAAAEFSFFLAIPTVVGASFLKIVKFIIEGSTMKGIEFAILLVGCVVSFFASLFVIRKLVDYVRKHSFSAFGIYRIGLGVLVLLYFLIK